MYKRGLNGFIQRLEEEKEIARVTCFADPLLEIAEITDRVSKNKGKAVLFENTGTNFPLLINAFGSEKRCSLSLGHESLDKASEEIERTFLRLLSPAGSLGEKLKLLPSLLSLARIMPSRSSNRGRCQEIVKTSPDLSELPVLKCWPHDGGRFITLPVVHTIHPVTKKPNAGMYRMQVINKNTTAMHWQLHKTGASHFAEWKKNGGRMPVSVILGGDPVYTYAATAPLPENIDEYILAGFLRKKRVKLVKCLTNELWVPEDADFVIEGYIDTAEEFFVEGPFGDHTGFYSLSDLYPRFHVTCITHAKDAVYPATIVGIPPQEDEYLAMATEKIFLPLIKLAMLPEVKDLHMPSAGVAHNLAVVKIEKKYSGQGMKVINSLLGAGQMMFSKYLVVVSGETDIRDYTQLASAISNNISVPDDITFSKGPLDVLDHASDRFAFGGKMGIDATVKGSDEKVMKSIQPSSLSETEALFQKLQQHNFISWFNIPSAGTRLVIAGTDILSDNNSFRKVCSRILDWGVIPKQWILIFVDHRLERDDIYSASWQLLGNTDPLRDHILLGDCTLALDGTIKAFRDGGFLRRWPNIVCSSEETITKVDSKWAGYGLGDPIKSPSLRYRPLLNGEGDQVLTES